MTAFVNPFDLRAILLARHAQHVVLVHFPIALFSAAVAFDAAACWTKRRPWLDAAYYNLTLAAVSALPVLLTGVLAWQFALDGQRLKGKLLLHLALGGASSTLIALSWWMHFRSRQRGKPLSSYRFVFEGLGMALVMMTGHLGGFLSGVNQ